MRSSEKTTSSAVILSPLWKVTSWRIFSSISVGETSFHEVASHGIHTLSVLVGSLPISVSNAFM